MKPTKRLRHVVIALLAAAVLAAACSDTDDTGSTSDDATTATADSSTTTAASVAADDDETSTDATTAEFADPLDSLRDPAEPFGVDASYDPGAELVVESFIPLEPGTYRTNALGTALSFTAAEPLFVQPNGSGMFVVTDPSSQGPDDRDLVFFRFGLLSDPSDPGASIDEHDWWPENDFAGWVAALHPAVEASEPTETSISGLPAVTVDLRLTSDISCGFLPGVCVGVAENNGQEAKGLNRGSSYRVWHVDQGDEDPLLVVAAVQRDSDADWFPRAEAILDTVALGDVGPNLVDALEPGVNRLPSLGGIAVTLPENIEALTNGRPRHIGSWIGRGFWVIDFNERPGAVYIVDRPHDGDGVPLGSPAELLDLLGTAGVELDELDPVTVGGVDARVFDMTADPSLSFEIAFRFSPEDLVQGYFGWDIAPAGRLWIIEHPERGFMTISTHVWEDVEGTLADLNVLGETFVSGIEFVD